MEQNDDFGLTTKQMPLYILAGCRKAEDHYLPMVEEWLQQLYSSFLNEPMAVESLKVGIISFSDAGKLVLPLTYILNLSIPSFEIGGYLDLNTAFWILENELKKDLYVDKELLKKRRGYRAIVLILHPSELQKEDFLLCQEFIKRNGRLIDYIHILIKDIQLNDDFFDSHSQESLVMSQLWKIGPQDLSSMIIRDFIVQDEQGVCID